MKTPLSRNVSLLSALILAAGAAGSFAASPEDLRAEARRLTEKAEALKAEGKAGAVEDLLREARKLEAQAREMSASRGRGERETPVRPAVELERLRGELKELEKNGRREEAAEVRERIQTLERRMADRPRDETAPRNQRRVELQLEIDELHRQGKHERAQQLERQMAELRSPEAGPRPDPRPREAAPNPERREHLRQAIEHLHAAGMPDLAQRIERMADTGMRAPMVGGPMGRGPMAGAGPMGQGPMAGRFAPMGAQSGQPQMMGDLQRALDEMREQLRELKKALVDTREELERRTGERERR